MFKMRKGKGQSALEYAVLVIIIAAALLTMQVYIKRGVQGRMKASTDDIGGQFSTVGNIFINTESYSHTNETVSGGVTTSNLISKSTTNRYENIDLDQANEEYWGK